MGRPGLGTHTKEADSGDWEPGWDSWTNAGGSLQERATPLPDRRDSSPFFKFEERFPPDLAPRVAVIQSHAAPLCATAAP